MLKHISGKYGNIVKEIIQKENILGGKLQYISKSCITHKGLQ